MVKHVETKYATIDRDELKRLQKDAERYRWIAENADVDCRGNAPDGDYESLDQRIDAAQQSQGSKTNG